jgi:hypothetical protein
MLNEEVRYARFPKGTQALLVSILTSVQPEQ